MIKNSTPETINYNLQPFSDMGKYVIWRRVVLLFLSPCFCMGAIVCLDHAQFVSLLLLIKLALHKPYVFWGESDNSKSVSDFRLMLQKARRIGRDDYQVLLSSPLSKQRSIRFFVRTEQRACLSISPPAPKWWWNIKTKCDPNKNVLSTGLLRSVLLCVTVVVISCLHYSGVEQCTPAQS